VALVVEQTMPSHKVALKPGKLSDQIRRTYRLQVLVSPCEAEAINQFQLQKRLPTFAAAVREILRRGLS
jgi:hypothetical protein